MTTKEEYEEAGKKITVYIDEFEQNQGLISDYISEYVRMELQDITEFLESHPNMQSDKVAQYLSQLDIEILENSGDIMVSYYSRKLKQSIVLDWDMGCYASKNSLINILLGFYEDIADIEDSIICIKDKKFVFEEIPAQINHL